MTSDDSKVSKIQTHFQALSAVAPTLNVASNELTQAVSVLDEALKKLNIGLVAWVPFRLREDDDSPEVFDRDQIGYAKVEGRWGIALRRIWGDASLDVHRQDGPWLFNDAPRELRLLGVDRIPELIEALAKEAFNTAKRVQEKTKEVRELADAIEAMANELNPAKMAKLSDLLKAPAGGRSK